MECPAALWRSPPVREPSGAGLPGNLPDEVFDLKAVNLTVPVTVTPIISPDNYFIWSAA